MKLVKGVLSSGNWQKIFLLKMNLEDEKLAHENQ